VNTISESLLKKKKKINGLLLILILSKSLKSNYCSSGRYSQIFYTSFNEEEKQIKFL
jgi:hypothetical protein